VRSLNTFLSFLTGIVKVGLTGRIWEI